MLKQIIHKIILNILLIISSTFLFIINTWDSITLNEIIFHITNPIGNIDTSIYNKFLSYIFIPFIMFNIYISKHKNIKIISNTIIVISVMISIIFIYKIDIYNFIKYKYQSSNFIENYYVDPNNITIKFEEKRNLIFIYLESMEISYADSSNGGMFETNLIPNLTQLAHENEDFSGSSNKLNGGYALTGCTWTMASIFAQSTGLPLNIPLGGNAMDSQDSFFPNIVGIGQILKQHGYTNVLLQGSDATFAGAKNFFRDHGEFKIIDYNYMVKNNFIDNTDFAFWGIEDYRLFEFAKNELIDLYKKYQPFNMTIVTIDTHTSNGYLSKYCKQPLNDIYNNAILCSDEQVSEFIKWVQQQDFYKNTTIVIVGDHPNMKVGFNSDKNYTRKCYTCYINSKFKDKNPDKQRFFSTFDNFPTTLAAIGAIIEGDKLGLGTNLFSDSPTLSEQFGYTFQDLELYKRSNFLHNKFNIILTDSMMSGIHNYDPLIYSEYDDNEGKITINIIGIDVTNDITKIFIKLFNYNDLINYRKLYLKKNEYFQIPNTNVNAYWYKVDIDIKNQDDLMYYIAFYSDTNSKKQRFLGSLQGDLKLKTINLYTYLDYLSNSNYTIFISAKGGIDKNINYEFKQKIEYLGLVYPNFKDGNINYVAVIDNKNIYSTSSSYAIEYNDNIASDNKKYYIYSDINKSSIVIDGIDYSHNQDGLNFVIYNNRLGRIADIATFDIDTAASFLNEIKVR